jgi:hypothetical protein
MVVYGGEVQQSENLKIARETFPEPLGFPKN